MTFMRYHVEKFSTAKSLDAFLDIVNITYNTVLAGPKTPQHFKKCAEFLGVNIPSFRTWSDSSFLVLKVDLLPPRSSTSPLIIYR